MTAVAVRLVRLHGRAHPRSRAELERTPEWVRTRERIEKIMAPHASIIVSVGALKPGAYAFFGDYNPTLAKGVLHVVPAQGH